MTPSRRSRQTTSQRLRLRSGPAAVDVLETTDAASAYRIQSLNTEFWRASGRRIVGRKIGLTAKAVQAQLGVDQPDYGVLFALIGRPYVTRAGSAPGAAAAAWVLDLDGHRRRRC